MEIIFISRSNKLNEVKNFAFRKKIYHLKLCYKWQITSIIIIADDQV